MNINKSDSLKFCLNFLTTHMKQDFTFKSDQDKADLKKNELDKYFHYRFGKVDVRFELPMLHYPYFLTDNENFNGTDIIHFFKDRMIDLEMNFLLNKFNDSKFHKHYQNLSTIESIFFYRYFESKKIYFIRSQESTNEKFYLIINMSIFFDNIHSHTHNEVCL